MEEVALYHDADEWVRVNVDYGGWNGEVVAELHQDPDQENNLIENAA